MRQLLSSTLQSPLPPKQKNILPPPLPQREAATALWTLPTSRVKIKTTAKLFLCPVNYFFIFLNEWWNKPAGKLQVFYSVCSIGEFHQECVVFEAQHFTRTLLQHFLFKAHPGEVGCQRQVAWGLRGIIGNNSCGLSLEKNAVFFHFSRVSWSAFYTLHIHWFMFHGQTEHLFCMSVI